MRLALSQPLQPHHEGSGILAKLLRLSVQNVAVIDRLHPIPGAWPRRDRHRATVELRDCAGEACWVEKNMATKRLARRARLLKEAEKMRETPGIVFADGAAGRRARIAGTGIDVFELIKAYYELGQDENKLREALDWLTEAQLKAALSYYRANPLEIDARLREEERLEEQHALLS